METEGTVLNEVVLVVPRRPAAFGRGLLACLREFGVLDGDCCRLTRSDAALFPQCSVRLDDVTVPTVRFVGDQVAREIVLTHAPGPHRRSPHTYRHISLVEFLRRSATLRMVTLDHIGCDLPWFDGVHPEVLALRAALAAECAYHRFPTGEDWDFILPATAAEIAGAELDPATVRRPKFEIVSIDTVSVPIVQIDVITDRAYADLVRLFPEALADPGQRNIWVYLENPYDIDVCFVLNERKEPGDWSAFFRGHRLAPSASGGLRCDDATG